MLSNSHVSISTVRKNLKWLWLPATGLTVLASLRSDLVLQLLSAMAMFTLLFALVAALAVLIVLVLVEAVHVLEWAAAQFASTGGRYLLSSACDVGGFRSRTSVVPHVLGGRRRRN